MPSKKCQCDFQSEVCSPFSARHNSVRNKNALFYAFNKLFYFDCFFASVCQKTSTFQQPALHRVEIRQCQISRLAEKHRIFEKLRNLEHFKIKRNLSPTLPHSLYIDPFSITGTSRLAKFKQINDFYHIIITHTPHIYLYTFPLHEIFKAVWFMNCSLLFLYLF